MVRITASSGAAPAERAALIHSQNHPSKEGGLMLLESLAKEMVEAVSGLVGGRTINIMDTKGIIVASSDPARVGSFHQGAVEAARTGKMVSITREQTPAYPGAKEGCNMPLRVNGTIIGVVGILGDPPEIQALAHLLEVYAAKYFQLEAMAIPRLAERELRGRVLRALLAPTDRSMADAEALMDSLGIRLDFPLLVMVFSDQAGAAQSERQEQLLQFLAAQGWLRPDRELWGTVDDRLVLLCGCADRSPAALYHRGADQGGILAGHRICVGEVCRTARDIAAAYQQAAALEAIAPQAVSDLRDPGTRCGYILYCAAIQEADFLEQLYARLRGAFREGELPLLLQTAECYYRRGRSVTQAAAELFIHKNTLQYRMRRLLGALELERCGPFQEEFLVRLLLEHCKRQQSRTALE